MNDVNVIETERLLLVPVGVSRLEEFVALVSDPEVMRYWGPEGAFSRGVAEQSFAASLARIKEHGFGRRWVVDKASGIGLGFTDTKYFGESCPDVSPDEVEIAGCWRGTPGVTGTRRRPGPRSATRHSSRSS